MSVQKSFATRAARRPVRLVLQVASPVLLGFALLAACATSDTVGVDGGGGSSSSSGGGSGGNGSGNGSGSSSGAGTSSASSGAGSSSSGGGARSGSSSSGSGSNSSSSGGGGNGSSSGGGGLDGGGSGSGGVDAGYVCPNSDKSILNIDPTGFVDRTCNQYNIQGAWYCFANTYGAPEDNCTLGTTPYSASGGGMCLSGTIPVSTSAYVGMGLELNASGGTNAVKSAYNATENNVIGFAVTLAGTSGGATVRIGFTGNNGSVTNYVAPFVSETLNGTTTYPILFPQAVVPPNFTTVSDPNGRVDSTSIYDIQVEIPGGTAAAYNLCITSIAPILSGGDGGAVGGSCSALMTAGGQNCTLADVTPAGNYGLQNNVNNGATGECVQGVAGGTCAGMTATFGNGFGNAGMSSPQSYPSLVYGWQNGVFYGGYPAAKQLSTIASAQSNWQFTVPSSGTWDVSYDTWFSPSRAPATSNGGLELMVWPAALGGKNPAGSDTGQSVSFPGGPWEIWRGTISNQLGSWAIISYKRASSSSSTVSPDLLQFFNDALTRNVGLQTSWYLLGIQAGFEVWQQNAGQNMVTNTFSVNVTTH
jgi:Glycosyl hydrolase family 12